MKSEKFNFGIVYFGRISVVSTVSVQVVFPPAVCIRQLLFLMVRSLLYILLQRTEWEMSEWPAECRGVAWGDSEKCLLLVSTVP